jgi:hypothetical protein
MRRWCIANLEKYATTLNKNKTKPRATESGESRHAAECIRQPEPRDMHQSGPATHKYTRSYTSTTHESSKCPSPSVSPPPSFPHPVVPSEKGGERRDAKHRAARSDEKSEKRGVQPLRGWRGGLPPDQGEGCLLTRLTAPKTGS